jgi:nucleoside-diphosphate-sugar epimerase
MTGPIVISGFGPVGRALTRRLLARGDRIKLVQRSVPGTVPAGAEFIKADLESSEGAGYACAGASTVVCTVGMPYRSPIYTRVWPIVMQNLLDACARSGARFVFADNLYMYGPQTEPLTEDMPLTDFGHKPRVRAEITRLWQKAHRSGCVRATAVRASDFYGPDAATSVLSTFGVARLLAGKPALAPYPPDYLHDFTYVPDFARALVTLIDAPDDAYGEAWHVPNAPTETLRQLIKLAAKLIGTKARLTVLPQTLAPLIGLFDADVRELAEMRFQWDRPYRVDSSKFAQRFWSDATPFEQGLTETIDFYRRTDDTRHSHGG